MLPDKITWDEIRVLYEKAKSCLWCPKNISSWHREEENGWYYMWSAYHYAMISDVEGTDHRTLARTLFMLSHELDYKISDYERYRKFLLLAVQEYEKAVACGQNVEDAEFRRVKEERESLEYRIKHEDETEENLKDMLLLIENSNLLDEKGFGFHDSKPCYFQHTDKKAILKLEYEGLLATFIFEGVYSIEINTDPLTNWVHECYCYRIKETGHIKFSVGDYCIICTRVSLQDLKNITSES